MLTGASQPAIEHRPFAADGDLIQRDPDGDPFLQHRTGSKWKLFGPNQPLIVPELIAPLRRGDGGAAPALDGRNIPRPRAIGSVREAEEAELIGQKRFRYDDQ